MLWEKDPRKKYTDYFAGDDMNLAELDEIFARSKPLPKSDVISHKLREEGNIEFGERNWSNAIKAFNYALCFAENGSEALSHAYANRSACLFELDQFENCLKDIKLALESSKCSQPFEQMIIQHQKDCTDFIQNIPSPKNVDQTNHFDFEPNLNIPSLSNALQVEKQMVSGYRAIANCDIDVGAMISIEMSPVSKLTDNCCMRCCICFAKSNNLMPCQHCTKAMFCSKKCQTSILHAAECNFGEEIDGNGKLAFLTRTILYAVSLFKNANELMRFVGKCVKSDSSDKPLSMVDDKSKYQHFLSLQSDLKIVRAEKRDPLIYLAYKSIMVTNVATMFSTKTMQRFLVHLIWQHDAIISLGHVHQFVNEEEQESLHLSLIFSLFAHSCTPNAMRYFNGNKLFVRAIRPIKKGQSVTVSYFGNRCFEGNDVERQEYLELLANTFKIKCSCDLCEGHVINEQERESMATHTSYKYIFWSMYEQENQIQPMNLDEIKRNAKEFLQKFGQSKWCKELEIVTAAFMDAFWLQSNEL